MHLASKGVAWASVNQAVCALRFFYGVTLGEQTIPERIAYAREPRKLPVVLSADEVVRFLELVSSLKARVALTTAYAAGLRVSEVAALKVHRLRLSTPSSRCAAGPQAPRLVRSDLARLSLTRFVVVAAQRPRMPAAERANPSNIASRRLPGSRGRDGDCSPPLAQIPACGFPAPGSCRRSDGIASGACSSARNLDLCATRFGGMPIPVPRPGLA